ncbi:unnamed protein product [Dovyalis caffra]|uniref:Bet v I/Major latex protein domain-containing protein n=1 Tax=Dovyalis caffra TaxID=77055 RepID=A0AAV1R1I7_9ROSI|nr:unnamed protein product [Dovyalis caffra]
MSPAKIHNVDLHEGDWGKPGTVICWSYVHDQLFVTLPYEKRSDSCLHLGDLSSPASKFDNVEGVSKIAKEVIEAIDDVKLSTTFKVIEGDITTEYKNFILIVQATPKGDGSCVVNWTLEYEKLNENIPDPHTLLEFCIQCSKDIEDHHLTQLPVAQA